MSPVFLFFAAIPLMFLALMVLSRCLSGRSRLLVSLIATCMGLPTLLFCVFGFLASFEPGPSSMPARILYVALFIGLSACLWFTWKAPNSLGPGHGDDRNGA